MKKVVFTITDMECVSCSITIDNDLEDSDGVKTAKTNYVKAQTEVTFDSTKVSEKEIIAIIKQAGYTARPL